MTVILSGPRRRISPESMRDPSVAKPPSDDNRHRPARRLRHTMIQSTIRGERAPFRLSAIASLIVAIGVALNARAELAVSAQGSNTPTIESVGAGFQGYFKVGFWTPVRVNVRNADGLANP